MANKKTNKITIRRVSKLKRLNLFPLFFIAVCITGIVAGVKSYKYAYNYAMEKWIPKSEKADGEDRYSPNDIIQQAKENMIGSDIDGVIKDIDFETGTVTFLNLKANETVVLKATKNTTYPGTNSLDDYFIGDIVTFVYDADNNLTDIKKCSSDNAKTYSDVGLVINTSAKLIRFDGTSANYADTVLKYNPDITTVRYKNKYSTLDSIDSSDFVTVKSYKTDNSTEKVYSITIDRSHGDLHFLNFANIDSPQFEINGQKNVISGDGTFRIMEGKHTITVTSPICETYTKDIIILPEQVCTVDLSAMQIKSGLLQVSANVVDFRLFIDEKEYPLTEPILLNYGKHNLEILKDGYEPYSKTININNEVNTLDADLEKHIPKGSIRVSTDPQGATVYIDGTAVGSTPGVFKTTLGNHSVEVRRNEYIDETRSAYLANEGDEESLSIPLMPIVSKYVESDGE